MVSTVTNLGAICDFVAGYAWKADLFTFDPEGLPVIRIQNLGDNENEKVAYWSRDFDNRFLIKNGDLLVSLSGSFKVVRWSGNNALLNQRIVKLEPAKNIDQSWLCYFLTYSLDKISKLGRHALVSNVSLSDLKSLSVSIPTIEKQRRIVDILSRAEGIVRLRREAQKKAAEIIPALFIDMFGDPATNPKGWPDHPLNQLAKFVSGGTPSKSREDFWQGNLPWVSPKDMKTDDISDSIDHIDEKVVTETSLKLIPTDSVLIVVRGMILAHTVPVARNLVPITINQDMKAIIPGASIIPVYLQWLLKVLQPKLLNEVSTAAHGTRKLETSCLEKLVIPIPSLEIQNDFAHRVAQIRSIQSQQTSATLKSEATFDALLGGFFQ